MLPQVITPAPGVSAGIGFYLSGMNEVREQLREAITGMNTEQIGRRAVPGAHSIGALALHIGEAEWWWIQCRVGGHKLTAADRASPHWDVLEDPEAFGSKGYSAEFCLQVIDRIREQTRDTLASFGDDDLERIFSFERHGETREHSLRWILHHLIDHEAQHKGQILMLKRLMPGEP
jgi:uncharacterized damage-inducible protein DinB